jgi:hypothetical protein
MGLEIPTRAGAQGYLLNGATTQEIAGAMGDMYAGRSQPETR